MYHSLIACDNQGGVMFKQVVDPLVGTVSNIDSKSFRHGFIGRCQWFPLDNGMFHLMYNDGVTIVDTNTLNQCETFNFGARQVFWTDWNPSKPELISVAASESTIRLIDIRSGSSAQNIVVSSCLQSANHSITSIVWDKLDPDCFFAGDTEGYIHIYDIRSSRNSMTRVHDDTRLCEPIVCLQFTTDCMSLLSLNAMRDKLNLWSLKNKSLQNSNTNFQLPQPSKPKTSRVPNRGGARDTTRRQAYLKNPSLASLIKPQVYVSHDLVFSSGPSNKTGTEIIVNDLNTGSMVKKLGSDTYNCNDNLIQVNSIIGLHPESLVVYSGGYNSFKVWSVAFYSENRDQELRHVHNDCWSDESD